MHLRIKHIFSKLYMPVVEVTRSSATAESTARPILVPIESSCTTYLHRFQVMADYYWSNFR